MSTKDAWTKPYHGVQHYGKCSTRTHWATVEDHGASGAALMRWFPGCQFSPHESWHATADEARRVGAEWVARATP